MRRHCPPLAQEYWNHRDEISEAEGIMFKGEKIIVPQSLRQDMLDRIHAGHMGVEKCKNRARDLLFWPGMGQQIETLVGQCSICQERRSANTKEPLLSHAIPQRPWQVVGTDLFAWNGQDFITIVDYYSRYFEMEKLNSCTASAVIAKLKAAFARHGIPERVISDNGPCYSAAEFEHFAKMWEFTHITTSPRYPQSNGLAEKTVQTAKRILDKAKADHKDPYIGLLEYRNTPVDNLKSPAQLLMSRRLRSILPATASQLQPKVTPQRIVKQRREACQHRQQLYYNRSAKTLPLLPAGAPIRFRQEDGSWRPATVTQPAHTERSYHIQTEEGQTFRRNRRHLRESKELQGTPESNQPVPQPKMKAEYQELILKSCGATSLRVGTKIQTLWSGYGEIVRVHLEGCERPSVVVKHVKFPAETDQSTDMSHTRKVRSYQVETHWYQNYSTRPSCRIPACLASCSHGDEMLIVLEDLDVAGYDQRRTSVGNKEMKACLSWLANFHAIFLGREPDAAAHIDRILTNCHFKTIVHGDAKLANFCFSKSGKEVAAVDFQYVGGGCGMKDVVYFLGSCMEERECEKKVPALLDYYFSELENAVDKGLDFAALEKEWREMFAFAWTDFHRFLLGWMPGHWKINRYSKMLTKELLGDVHHNVVTYASSAFTPDINNEIGKYDGAPAIQTAKLSEKE
ncbi:hypothetical protein WMY93_025589 [Mugilogobius chulae]|uniref:Gypsy retrotransposon integrase-like protein 1 n=1 Tax=Mugilogobius chulae TaxID=88201 RepID=A0AAW0MZB0_9GOBI